LILSPISAAFFSIAYGGDKFFFSEQERTGEGQAMMRAAGRIDRRYLGVV
jgi:hypothetical protein